jgi:hypothetical protein
MNRRNPLLINLPLVFFFFSSLSLFKMRLLSLFGATLACLLGGTGGARAVNVTDLIAAAGYPQEQHYVFTTDGFVLSVQRIPHGKAGPGSAPRPVVLLQVWCRNGKKKKKKFLFGWGPTLIRSYTLSSRRGCVIFLFLLLFFCFGAGWSALFFRGRMFFLFVCFFVFCFCFFQLEAAPTSFFFFFFSFFSLPHDQTSMIQTSGIFQSRWSLSSSCSLRSRWLSTATRMSTNATGTPRF